MGCESAKGNEDLPESGGWDGSRDHGIVVPQVWTPDREHQYQLGDVLEMEITAPARHTALETRGLGPSELQFKELSTQFWCQVNSEKHHRESGALCQVRGQ